MRKIVALMGDGHSGHLAGLLYPETIVKTYDPDAGADGRMDLDLSPTPLQEDCYNTFSKSWQNIKQLAGKSEIIVVDNGDYVQGGKYEEGLQVKTIDQQIDVAAQAKQIIYQDRSVKQVYMTFSTPSHAFLRNGSDVKLIDKLRESYKRVKFSLSHHYLLNVGGVKIDVSHHGPGPGAREWTKGNILKAMTKSRIYELDRHGFEVPDVFCWAHVHTPQIELHTDWKEGKRRDIYGLITPPLSWMNHYARKATKSAPVLAMGMFALEIVDGRVAHVHDFMDWYDVRKPVNGV